jgi:hypothetical protein
VTTDTWFEGHCQNSAFSCFLPIFLGYSTEFSIAGIISGDCDHRYMIWVASPKLIFFLFSAYFHEL